MGEERSLDGSGSTRREEIEEKREEEEEMEWNWKQSDEKFKEKQNMDWNKRYGKLILSYLNKHKHINEHEKEELCC